MKTLKICRLSLLVILIAFAKRVQPQSIHPLVPSNYVFDDDSLRGFDENLFRQMALNAGAYGDEFKVYMYAAKREYIKTKFKLSSPSFFAKGSNPLPNPLSSACMNEDFEASTGASPVAITTAGGISGWTCSRGTSPASPIASCNLATTPNPPNAVWLISPGAGGYIDPVIGSGYPIYSVFGNNANPGGTSTAGIDTMRGDWFVKLNTNSGGADIHKLSKTISVTPNNALFRFAFISVLEGAHCCCENGAFVLQVKDCSNNVLSCPQFTASAPSTCSGESICASTGNSTSYLTAPSPYTTWRYNKWKVTTLDLTPYIGSCVTIDVIAVDCAYGGHSGYAYFDAQCLPMCVVGNNICFPAGTPNITLPTCGSGSTATITAPAGTGPWTWTGPAGFTPSTNQTIVTGITGFYTLTMNPAGSCAPITRTINVIISPAPNLVVSNQVQFSCASPTLNSAAIQMASGTPGAGTPNYTVSWSPPPSSVVGSSATSQTVSGLSAGINTISIVDSVGCIATKTINVTPPPPVPNFSISAPSGTVVGCNPPSITLNAVNMSTLSNVSYTWTSIQTGVQSGTSSVNGSVTSGTLNTYTITAQDTGAGSCAYTTTFQVAANTAVPGVTVNPVNAIITCNGAGATFTATSSSTTNIVGQWFDGGGNPLDSLSGTPLLLGPVTNPGTYTAVFTNITNGCTSSQTVAVTANTTVPTMTINAPTGTKITCSVPCLTLNITASAGPAAPGYTWTNLSTSVSVSPPTGGYTVCSPGNYLAEYKDGNNCRVSQQITITIDTMKPIPTAISNLPSNSFTLNCYHPVLTASAVTNPMLPVSSYSWIQPSPSLVVSTPTMMVNTTSVTSNPTTFTVLAQGANGCVGRSKVLFYEDLATPNYKVVFTPTAITCSNPNVAVSLQYVSGPSGASDFTITSPPPTTTANASGSLFNIPGVYTASVTLQSNGCTAAAQSATVPLNTTPPATVATPNYIVIPCGSPTVNISAGTLTTSTSYSYAWSGPVGAGIGQPNKNTTSVNMPGDYDVVITNSVNGCIATNEVKVGAGALNVAFTADKYDGFAPLPVSFVNTSALGATTGTAVVMTSWSYGNGSAYTATNTSAGSANGLYNGATTYSAAGVYTVTLYMTQAFGTSTCVGTASAVITVDIPSKLVVPNVFTPNKDGVNDIFMVNSANITDISCLIFDRWGVKMYDVNSETGNIAWDGKNLTGKEAPSGTYFYIIKAKGKDEIPYEYKGTVSLFR